MEGRLVEGMQNNVTARLMGWRLMAGTHYYLAFETLFDCVLCKSLMSENFPPSFFEGRSERPATAYCHGWVCLAASNSPRLMYIILPHQSQVIMRLANVSQITTDQTPDLTHRPFELLIFPMVIEDTEIYITRKLTRERKNPPARSHDP